MKIAATTLAYNDEGIIAGTIRCLKPFVEKHIVLISEKPYFGETSPPDKTECIAESLDVDIVKGVWPLDHYQRNIGIELCQDVDWIITFDSDEMMTKDSLEKFISFLEKTSMPAVAVKPEVYWKTTDYRLRPKPDYTPILAVRPHVRFSYIRNIDAPYTLWEGTMHHLSWCAPKDIYKKVIHYAHATDFDGDTWYKENYESWTDTSKYAKLPTGEFFVVKNPLPTELKTYLEEPIHA